MRNMLAPMLVLAMSCPVQAQVFKCTDASGKTVYSQAACPAQGEQMRPGQLSGNAVGTVQVAPPPAPSTTPAPAVIPGAGCPSDTDIRNMEMSASAMRLPEREKLRLAADIAAARSCKPPGPPRPDYSALERYDRQQQQRRDLSRCTVTIPPGSTMGTLNCR